MPNGTVKYKQGDSVYFIQTHFDKKEQIFLDPSEWQAERQLCDSLESSVDNGPQIVIIDLAGHFVCGLICKIIDVQTMFNNEESVCVDVLSFIKKLLRLNGVKSRDPPINGDLQNCLIIFNTTAWSYIDKESRAPAWVYDSFFSLSI